MHIKVDLTWMLCSAYDDMAGFSARNTRGVTETVFSQLLHNMRQNLAFKSPGHPLPMVPLDRSHGVQARPLLVLAVAVAAAAPPLPHQQHHNHQNHVADDLPVANGPEPRNGLEVAEVEKPAPEVLLPRVVVLCKQRHQGIDEATAAAAAPSTSGLVSKWRPKDRVMDAMPFADAAPTACTDVMLDCLLDSARCVGIGGTFLG